jgi:hypothetical protein
MDPCIHLKEYYSIYTGLMGKNIVREKSFTYIQATKYRLYIIKIISLERSFKCESNGIIFETYNLYFIDQICGQSFS